MFTITAGRTGTAWLADFLTANQKVHCVHEPLEIEDFGFKMPDIKTMRAFNNYGNIEIVKSFWRRKFGSFQDSENYYETNHTLAKCGLIENLSETSLAQHATIIILRRDIAKQCTSYLLRNDFGNITLAWQWYLHPSYRKKIVGPEPFLKFGPIGIPLWYCFEMLARQEYYKRLYSERLNFLEVSLEEVADQNGANIFLRKLGNRAKAILPPPANQNRSQAPDQLQQKIRAIVAALDINIEDLVSGTLKRGFTFE